MRSVRWLQPLRMKLASEPLRMKVRPLRCEMGLLSQPDGSCSWHQGDTVMLAAAYGPGDVRPVAELVGSATVDVVYQPAAGMTGTCAHRFDEHVVLATCRAVLLCALHPRTAVNVVIQEVTDGGGRLAAAVNAACLCLLDAGLAMRQTVAAVAAAVTADDTVVVDPTTAQEADAVACLTFVFGSGNKQRPLLSCRADGRCTDEQFQLALRHCRSASSLVFDFYRQAVSNKLTGPQPPPINS